MKVLITGGQGFLGWHLACRLHVLHDIEPQRLGRPEFSNGPLLAELLRDADVVFHLAGVNRAESDEEVGRGNIELADTLGSAIIDAGSTCRVVYANSIQSRGDSAYGRGKAQAARLLRDAVDTTGGSMADVLLPNLFGEHGRPHYNSFVATFCHLVAEGGSPTVNEDGEVPLLHAQAAADALISQMHAHTHTVLEPSATPRKVTQVLAMLQEFDELYRRGEIPFLADDFSVDLFNTYRSYTFPQRFPHMATVHADSRGELFETVRSHGGTGQSFVSLTRPGQTRGEHYHLRKFERFFIVKGKAEIQLRQLLHDEVITFTVSGDRPAFVDMPTLWVHNVTNVGEDDLITVFWADQLLDFNKPDQYPERVVKGSLR